MSSALFISNGDRKATELANSLSMNHRIRKCSCEIDDFLIKVDDERPEFIVVVTNDKFDETNLYMYVQDCPDTPFVVLGTQELISSLECDQKLPLEWIKFVKVPATVGDVLKQADILLIKRKSMGGGPKQNAHSARNISYKRFMGTDQPHVLLVDDDPMVIRAMQKTLAEKYTVSFATSGRQAVSVMLKKIPDVILLDYEMPEMDGVETLKKIRSDQRTRLIPVIFLTGIAEFDRVYNALEMRPQGYLLKPCAEDRLFSEIEKVLGKGS